MPALIIFTDKVLHICELKDIFTKGKLCSVKYDDKRKYAARVLALCNDKVVLNKLKSILEGQAAKTNEIWVRGDETERGYAKLSREIAKITENTVLFADKLFLSEKWNSLCLSKFLSSLQDREFFKKPSQFIKFITVDKVDIEDANKQKSTKRKKSRRSSYDSGRIIKRPKNEEGQDDSEDSESPPHDTVDRQDPEYDSKSSPSAEVSEAQEAPPIMLPFQNSRDDLIRSNKKGKCRRRLDFDEPTISGHEKVRNDKKTGLATGSGTTVEVIPSKLEILKTKKASVLLINCLNPDEDLIEKTKQKSYRKLSIPQEHVNPTHGTASNVMKRGGRSDSDVTVEGIQSIPEVSETLETSAVLIPLLNSHENLNEEKKLKSGEKLLIFEEPAISGHETTSNLVKTEGESRSSGVIQLIPEVSETQGTSAAPIQLQKNHGDLIKEKTEERLDSDNYIPSGDLGTENLESQATHFEKITSAAAALVKSADDDIETEVSNTPALNETFTVTSKDTPPSQRVTTTPMSNLLDGTTPSFKEQNLDENFTELQENDAIVLETANENESASLKRSSSPPPKGLDDTEVSNKPAPDEIFSARLKDNHSSLSAATSPISNPLDETTASFREQKLDENSAELQENDAIVAQIGNEDESASLKRSSSLPPKGLDNTEVSNKPAPVEIFTAGSKDTHFSLSAVTSPISNPLDETTASFKEQKLDENSAELQGNDAIVPETDNGDEYASPELSTSPSPKGLDTFIKTVTTIYQEQKVPITESMIEDLVNVYNRDLATAKLDDGRENESTKSGKSRDDDVNRSVENAFANETFNLLSGNMKPNTPGNKSKKNPQIIKTESIKTRYKLVKKDKKMMKADCPKENQRTAHPQQVYDDSSPKNSDNDDIEENFGIPQAQSSLREQNEKSTDMERSFKQDELEHFSENADSSDVYEPDEDDGEESDSAEFSSDGDAEIEKGNSKQEPEPIVPLDITHGDDAPVSAPDDRELRVDSSSSGAKKHFCLYCKKFQTKFARHLQLVHKNEEDVKKFMHLPARNSERQQIIAIIRKKGDFLFNSNKELNTGSLIVCRRPQNRMNKTAEDFQVCGKCKGQYVRSVIRHHSRKCFGHDGMKQRVVMVQGRKIAARVHPSASKDVRNKLYPYMNEDPVVKEIRYDGLVTIYANKMAEKYGTQGQSYKQVRANLRLCGRLLIAIKEIDNRIKDFSDILQPEYYDAVIRAVRVVTRYDEDTKLYGAPAVASGYGTLLKKLAELLRNEYIKKKMPTKREEVDNFIKLLEVDYGISINRGVAETQAQNNRRKKVVLPTTEDIKRLHDFIKTERDKYYEKLSEKFSYNSWEKLLKMTLLSLQIFNRRRPGEIERLYIEDFRSHRGLDHASNKEAYSGLSEEGKKLARKYSRFEIRGKLGRGVPVLIDKEVLDCLNLLIDHRKNAGVPDKNTYLFGLPSADNNRNRHLSACDLMREYSVKCGAEAPETLRGTTLRKHIATKCIALNLTDGQVSDLANFMGHAEKIHKDIYRQPVLEADIVRISKILNTAQGLTLSEDESDESSDREHRIPRRQSNRSTDNTGEGPSISNSTTSTISAGKMHWSDTEKSTTLAAFGRELTSGRVPSGKEMQEFIDENECMRGRTVPQLRTWLWTQKKKMTKH